MIPDKGRKEAWELFQKVFRNCKGYRSFLKSQHLFSNSFTPKDFEQLPFIDKHTYIKKYPIEQRIYDGKSLADFYMISSSSGSTGQPTFWPRDFEKDRHLAKKQESFCEDHFQISKKKTLCVVTYGLGVWTAGMLTAQFAWESARNNRFTVITPGMDKENALQMIQGLYMYYDQVIVFGYPPFLTDFVEYAKKQKFELRKTNMKFFCTSERFRESWRGHMAAHISKQNNRHDIVGFYACSDAGIIGVETPFTITLLGKAMQHKQLAIDLFGSIDLPSLVAYNPYVKYLEIVNEEIVLTADQAVPLIRYNMHDRGGIITNDQMKVICKKYAIPFTPESTQQFVYIWGRSDSVKITANIYIDDIKYCLEHSSFKDRLDGNFKYGSEPMKNGRERLKILIYIKQPKKMTKTEKVRFEKEFYDNLLVANNDFKMIQSGIKIEKFRFLYAFEDNQKYRNYKLKYFL